MIILKNFLAHFGIKNKFPTRANGEGGVEGVREEGERGCRGEGKGEEGGRGGEGRGEGGGGGEGRGEGGGGGEGRWEGGGRGEGRGGGGEGRGERGGGARARRGSKVADAVFTSYIYRTWPFTKLFTENINLNVVMFLIYFIFKVTNSLQIKQCLTTEKSPSRITRQH